MRWKPAGSIWKRKRRMYSSREVGLDNEDLRLLIVRDTKLREDHAVVAARLDGRWLVLDNRRLVLLEDIQLEQSSRRSRSTMGACPGQGRGAAHPKGTHPLR